MSFEQLFNEMINEKNNLEKIDQFIISNKRLNDMVMSHELKIKELNISNKRLTSNYDNIIINNLTVPGFVGNSCVYPNLSGYILHNINEVDKIKNEQEAEKKILAEYKYKNDNLMKNILNILDSSIKRCNTYTDKKQKYLEEFIQNKLVEINEKNIDLRAKIFTDINTINQHVDNFENQIREIKEMKTTIKNQIINILADFKEKFKNQEKKLTKKIEDKIKKELKKVVLDENTNKTQTQTLMKQNNYVRNENKFSTSYNKTLTERKKNSLFNPYNSYSSKNSIEKIEENKFDQGKNLNKKRTQIFTFKKDYKFLQMTNKMDKDDNSSESVHSENLNNHNKIIKINENKKGEKNKDKIKENKNNEISNKQKITIKKDDIIINDEEKKGMRRANVDEEKFSFKEDNSINNKFKNNIKIEKIVEKEDESKSKETELEYKDEEEEEDEQQQEDNNEEEKEENNNEEEIEEDNNEEEKNEEEEDEDKNDEEKISFIYKGKNAQKLNKEIKKLYDRKEDNKLNLNLKLKDEKNNKNENNDLKSFFTEVPDNKTIQQDIANDIKNINIPGLINDKNKTKVEKIKNKIKRSRNETFQSFNLHLYQNNFNSFNNLKKNMKISKLKNEIEPINTSSKSNSNSQTYINSIKDKEHEKENELKTINSERLLFNRTSPKFYIKDKKYENIQTEKKYNKFSFPRLYCNFKLINLGSNIHFIKKDSQLEQSKDKTKENKKINIDFMSPITNTYKAYQKKKKEKKVNNNIINNIYQNKISLNEQKKIELELKGEAVKLLNLKNNHSITSLNIYNNNKKNLQNAENQTEIK